MGDMPPLDRTVLAGIFHLWPFDGGEGEFHAGIEILRGADRLCSEAG